MLDLGEKELTSRVTSACLFWGSGLRRGRISERARRDKAQENIEAQSLKRS